MPDRLTSGSSKRVAGAAGIAAEARRAAQFRRSRRPAPPEPCPRRRRRGRPRSARDVLQIERARSAAARTGAEPEPPADVVEAEAVTGHRHRALEPAVLLRPLQRHPRPAEQQRQDVEPRLDVAERDRPDLRLLERAEPDGCRSPRARRGRARRGRTSRARAGAAAGRPARTGRRRGRTRSGPAAAGSSSALRAPGTRLRRQASDRCWPGRAAMSTTRPLLLQLGHPGEEGLRPRGVDARRWRASVPAPAIRAPAKPASVAVRLTRASIGSGRRARPAVEPPRRRGAAAPRPPSPTRHRAVAAPRRARRTAAGSPVASRAPPQPERA